MRALRSFSLLTLACVVSPLPLGAQPADADYYVVPIEGSPARGAADAPVTIIEFADFECPFCSRVTETLRRILETYPGRVRLVFKQNPLPFHTNAQLAAEAALAAGAQGRFWEMHDLMFRNQTALGRADLERYAVEIGLNLGAFRRALDSGEHRQAILRDQELATRLGARGTPSFFINGRPVRGAQPYDAFRTVVDEQIAAAGRLLARGVRPRDLYDELTRGGLSRAPDPPPSAPTPPRQREDPSAIYRVELGTSPVRGPETALVTIVEWMDYQCPFCQRVQAVLRQVELEYGERVRIVVKMNPMPFHDAAMPAAEAAMAAHAQRKFFEMHERLLEAGAEQALERTTFDRIAAEIGLDMARFRADLDSHAHRSAIEAEQAQTVRLGARGAPAFFLNGRKLRGAQPIEGFRRVIDEEERRAREVLRRQRPRPGQLYELLTRGGATEPVYLPADAAADAPAAPADADRVYRIAVPPTSPSRGRRNAPVVIQEFSDFQCPFCSRVQQTLRDLESRHRNRLRIVFRHFPLSFHQDAMLAHEAAAEAHAQGKFWEYHDLLFANQRALSREDLTRYARQVGLDMGLFQAALDEHRHRAEIEDDIAASTDSGARHGTPSFFINGRLLQGAQDLSAFEDAVDAALRAPR
ncbi:MAG: thioredoxin domain-containing protein [Deltaproteobacteria bacterium]|nr:thioredoxin domain-containing protein [Deltaproteobacteria bacterium]